jgi:hypothetical protein
MDRYNDRCTYMRRELSIPISFETSAMLCYDIPEVSFSIVKGCN